VYGVGKSEELIGDLKKTSSTVPAIATKFAPLPWRFGADNVVKALKVTHSCADVHGQSRENCTGEGSDGGGGWWASRFLGRVEVGGFENRGRVGGNISYTCAEGVAFERDNSVCSICLWKQASEGGMIKCGTRASDLQRRFKGVRLG
jgi:hypothetical protein